MALRVAHIAEAFGGGVLEMVVELAEGAVDHGNEALIAYGQRPETPEDVRGAVDPRVQLHAMPWTRRTVSNQVKAVRDLRRLIREFKPDVVHLHSSFSGVLGSIVVPREIPTIFSPHAFASALPERGFVHRLAYRTLERVACRRVTVLGAVSRSEAEMGAKFGARRIIQIPNGTRLLDPGRAVTTPPGAPPRDPPLMVASGRTVPQRRPEACARILAGVRDVAEVAWLGGGGGARGVAGYEALAGVGIVPSGWLTREALLERLGQATAYLHYTNWDGLSFSILEALALDVVVVASDIPPNREILGQHGICGSEEEAIALLRRIGTDPVYAERLREAQRSRRAAFSAEAMVDAWLDAYENIAGSSRGASANGGRRWSGDVRREVRDGARERVGTS